MTGSGYLVFRGQVEFFPIVAVCLSATLLGDSIPFWIGRTLGKRALGIPLIAKVLHPERMELLEQRVESYGGWAVFTTRFLPGLRLPGFFTAGTAGMSYGRFLAYDGGAALFMVPMYVLIGRAFGEQIGQLENTVQNSTETLGFILLLVLSFVGVRWFVRRGDRRVAQAESGESSQADQDSSPPSG